MSTERLMATPYRFEINKGNSNSKQSQLEARIAIIEDQFLEDQGILKKNQTAFKTTWNNNFDILNENFKKANHNKGLTEDLKVIKKASLMVRRDALKKLYHQDYVQYEAELNRRGLCIHKERI